MSNRLSDPTNTVATDLDRRRGIRTQRDTDRDLRKQEKYGGSQDLLKRVTVNPEIKGKLTIQKQSDRALEIQNAEGLTQFIVGTQNEVNGTATPFFLIGGNAVDVFTFGLKVFGFDGDIRAPSGFLNMKTHSFARWSSGCHHVPGGTTLEVQGEPAWTQGGTIVSDDEADGSWALYTTAATIGSSMGPNGTARFRTDQEVEALIRIKTGSAVTNQRLWFGLFASDPALDDLPAQHFAGFRYSTAAGDTTWKCLTGDGAAGTPVDSTISVAANQTYYLRLRLNATSAKFIIGLPGVNDGFVNGTQTMVLTANLPTLTTRLTPFNRIAATNNAARGFRFGFANFVTR